ncbi:hypothetical protein EVAR_13652_1 [Eumeta japonica]|uniref:Uncharacterized protein n=1 Tax=Eumeta variegata TaxID=151549 RepID=A0A4C1UTG8_EUMVA|nr:hypothetical protein EVAR_13652_1 [Eumeta japonica]
MIRDLRKGARGAGAGRPGRWGPAMPSSSFNSHVKYLKVKVLCVQGPKLRVPKAPTLCDQGLLNEMALQGAVLNKKSIYIPDLRHGP